MQKHHFRNEALFPGSHCLNVPLKDRLILKKKEFMELSMMTQSVFQQWTESTGPTALLTVTIPPHSGSTSLPDRAMLAFDKAATMGPDLFSVNCNIFFFRKGAPTTTEQISLTVLSHIEPDIIPTMGKLHNMSLAAIPKELATDLVTTLFEFYEKVDPALMQPVLQQRVFSLQDNSYIGHICASCKSLNAPHQCPCREV